MSSIGKILDKILRSTSDRNIRFAELVRLLRGLGFDERIKGGHHIFSREGVIEILNLQPLANGKAKPYQVKQVRQLILDYKLFVKKTDS
jgi:hypothetical protein